MCSVYDIAEDIANIFIIFHKMSPYHVLILVVISISDYNISIKSYLAAELQNGYFLFNIYRHFHLVLMWIYTRV